MRRFTARLERRERDRAERSTSTAIGDELRQRAGQHRQQTARAAGGVEQPGAESLGQPLDGQRRRWDGRR